MAEIKALAMAQVRAGGPEALSLAQVVRDMSMSPAALYRYFESKDALLSELVVDAYGELADFVVGSAPQAASSLDRLAAVLGSIRAWALAHPNAYRLVFQTEAGSGRTLEPERTKAAASRSMAAMITALDAARAEAGRGPDDTRAVLPPTLDAAVSEWSRRSGLEAFAPDVLALGLLSWTRLHGVISLELAGHLPATGLDPAALYDAEVAAIARAATDAALDRRGREAR
ncbi:TetR/AcrR family transcriptional regulator [Jannaschia sp. R86511]|uniref:TetR/AcrR family transcriptional regulator n=1 Tax=Jannaschia sp. R86511 TaxID=3093853 RepID=UPI0036D43553